MSGVDLSSGSKSLAFIGRTEKRCPGSLGQLPIEI